MNEQSNYMSIPGLADEIKQLTDKLSEGKLTQDELIKLSDHTLALYERLVVIRYKALRENAGEEQTDEVVADNVYEQPGDEASQAEPEVSEPEPELETSETSTEEEINELNEEIAHEVEMPGGSSFRLNIPPISPNQISLIDSIEELSKEEKTLNQNYNQEPSTLGNRLKKSRISDLKTAIGINQRFLFISELFNNSAEDFNNAIEHLNSSSSFIEADDYIQNTLKQRYEWEMKNSTVRAFVELVERRYL